MTASVIGALRHRVVIERPERSSDEAGTATIAWLPLASLFARIEPVAGREIATADGVAGRITHKVMLRYRTDILPEMRIVAGTRILEIKAAFDADGRARWLQCLCEEHIP
jgi:SPP1 family predicted phage head-tail adaptor